MGSSSSSPVAAFPLLFGPDCGLLREEVVAARAVWGRAAAWLRARLPLCRGQGGGRVRGGGVGG